MSIKLIKLNGENRNINYSQFERSLINTLENTCSNAQIYLFNNFPVSVSVETNIDLIIIIAIEPTKGNYFRYKKNDRWIYLHNLIIPVKFITHLKHDKLQIEENQIVCNAEFIDYTSEINSLRFGLINYFKFKCGLTEGEIFIQPLIFIENDSEKYLDNYLINNSFDYSILNKYLENSSFEILISYKYWKTDVGYSKLSKDIEQISEQASKDSKIGFLTKKKIDRIGKQLSNSKKIYEELSHSLVLIDGKAGTGKSSELLLLTMKCISEGKNTLFLTYNKILIFDIAKTIKSYSNIQQSNNKDKKIGEGSVLTLHAFFFRLSKSLGVLHVLSEERIEKLIKTLKERMRSIYDLLHIKLKENNIQLDEFKTVIQNASHLDIATKEVGIDLINFIKRRSFGSNIEFTKLSIKFYEHKKNLLENIETNSIFLADYYGVLENTLLAIQDPDRYFDDYNLKNKHGLLEIILNLKDRDIEKRQDGIYITKEGFKEKANRKVGGYKRKRTLFIDEAQDCHRLEKDILISIYESDNLVVTNGGKEQLIRHVELCNWEVSQARRIPIKKYFKRNKSYRIKKTVVNFCNFVAAKFEIDLNLEPLESEDEGELLFDFRQHHTDHDIKDIISLLNLKGEVHGCNSYESLMILLESNSQRGDMYNEDSNETANINEYDNIEGSKALERGTWKHTQTLEKQGFMFWDGTASDKSQLIVPSPNESRIIYYESCRGLEAWSVACFSLDKFFESKRNDEDAEKYLIEDLFLNQDNEKRKSMYAATWALMALTRVIDTLYIQVNDRNSEFGKIVEEYLNSNPMNVKVMK